MNNSEINYNNSDDNFDISIRPSNFNNYIGQESLKSALKIFIKSALNREETLDHILIYGPSGLGKTSLANVIAKELSANLIFCNGPSIEKIGDLVSVLSSLKAGDILFIDEIHRIPIFIQETLYSAMEDFMVNININRDFETKSIVLQLPPFTLIGATTNVGKISPPLRARFGFSYRLHFYSEDELAKIVERTSSILNSKITYDACIEIAKRSRGTPRIANRIFRRVRDCAEYFSCNIIDKELTLKALKILNIDNIGLDEVDNRYLLTLINRFDGGPVGIETLASAIGEESSNLQEVYEPYLIQIGFIDKTLKGRIASNKAYKHLHIKKNKLID